MNKNLHIGMLAGEVSGDTLGAGLMRAILQHYPHASFSGIGGSQMVALGFTSLAPMERLSVMGLVEPLKRLPELLQLRQRLYRHFKEQPPAVFVGIDSPDFNLSLERKIRGLDIPVVHYVCPSVWAWRQYRVKKIREAVDLVLTLLPFEAEFLRRQHITATFVGHPLADQIHFIPDVIRARAALGVSGGTLIALLPGSRSSEIKLLGELFLQAALYCMQDNPGLQFIIPAPNFQCYQQLQTLIAKYESQFAALAGHELALRLVDGWSHTVMEAADVILLASGTATLEAMLMKKPMVVAYKMGKLSYAIISRMLKIDYVALPNLLANELLVPELLQSAVTPKALADAVNNYLANPKASAALRNRFVEFHQSLRCSADTTAAKQIRQLLENRR